jgi:phage-related protein
MPAFHYHTSGGKDLILEYIDSLPKKQSALGYVILDRLEKDGLDALEYLDTRHIKGKLWEIKFPKYNRIFYVAIEEKAIYLFHACKKQKDKAELFEIETAEKRMKEISPISKLLK